MPGEVRHRGELVRRCRCRVAQRVARPSAPVLPHAARYMDMMDVRFPRLMTEAQPVTMHVVVLAICACPLHSLSVRSLLLHSQRSAPSISTPFLDMPRLCLGSSDGRAPCVFRAQMSGNNLRCLFCDSERMSSACLRPVGRGQITALLRGFSPRVRAQALDRVPAEFRAHFDCPAPPARQCPGRPGEPCIFSASGKPARLENRKGRCVFCDSEALAQACGTDGAAQQLAAKLSKMSEHSRSMALGRALAEDRPTLLRLLECQQAPVSTVEEVHRRWAEALKKRVTTSAPHDSEALKKVLADRARARRQLARPQEAALEDAPRKRLRRQPELVDNDTGLPAAKASDLARSFEHWCTHHSWTMCSQCHSLAPRDLNEQTLTKNPPTTVSAKACVQCRGSQQTSVFQQDDVPEALRGLSDSVRSALVPLEIDVGPVVRAQNRGGYATGYRQHSTMMRFRWKPQTVRAAIRELPRPERHQAKAALQYLVSHESDCAYHIFLGEHDSYLDENPEADERQRRRRLQFIERVGLECALWPWLFWKTDMTFTHERASDPRRLARQSTDTLEEAMQGQARKRQRVLPVGIEEADSSGDEGAEEDSMLRHSIKRRFQRLALGPLLEYGSDFSLLQFVFDLHLWSDLGSKKNLGTGVPLRVMMKGNSFSPLCWKEVHFTLLDAVRQLGYPKLFSTLAPYEWSFPYHTALRDAVAKQLRVRLELPVLETLHITHVLLQTVRGLFVGSTASKPPWRSELFRVVDEQGRKKRVHAFTRLEFQDGHRKPASQDYHGSRRVHVHALFFVDDADVPQLQLERKLAATLPEDPDLRGYVQGSQLDRRGGSGWPVFHGAYDDVAGRKLHLHHTQEDKDSGDVLDVLKCHQDWQFADDAGVLRAYVTKYVSKFSDSASDEWLNDFADATAVAATVLMRYKPLEPEMILQLFGQRFRQWHVTTLSRGKRYFQVPWPEKAAANKPKEIEAYEAAAWARGRISLLDFLRKTNARGEIMAYIKKEHKARGGAESLEDFAAAFRVRGEKLVAADMVSRLNDHWYGQWLVLHVPFRRLEDLMNADVASKVPPAHRNFAWAVFSNHPVARATWTDETAIRAELKMEAHSEQHAETILRMVASTRNLLLDYLNGKYDAAAEIATRSTGAQPSATPTVPKWNAEQRHFKAKVDGLVDVVLELQDAGSEAQADELRERLWHRNKICVCVGPPGSGKSTVAHACVERALEHGGRVLFALPKAQLASRMRERYGDRVDIDTCHAAFAFHEEVNNLPTLAHYALVVVDEISQLDAWQYERIAQLWNAADRGTVVVLVGDKWQMPGFGDRRPWHSGFWHPLTFRVTLHEAFRCKNPTFWKLLSQLRTARPDKKNLKFLASKKPWRGDGPPSAEDARRLLKSRPDTTILTVSRRGAQAVNDAALQGLFPRHPPNALIDADVESNPENYVDGKLKALESLAPARLPVYVGMRVYLTRNVRKDVDFVNGMSCQVLGWDAGAKALRVETATGHRFAVWPWTDTDLGNMVYYPVRAGYASTVGRFQGAELPHVTLYLDAPGVPAAAYTGLSRVSTGKDFLLASKGPLTADHCVPARE